ncbi:hypothetical protein ABZ883_39540 [Streptomyces sp. NPDC046977]|uniref:hypothetical protein n=1 Tax=Streptomyces sp. NPDC046977 TaxID=3154703 RepID=UPI003400E360
MSPMWDGEPEHAAGTCAACGHHTEDGVVRRVTRLSGPDIRLVIHAGSKQCTPVSVDLTKGGS